MSVSLSSLDLISVSLSGPTALDISEHAEHAEETTIAHDAISGFGRAIHAVLLGTSSVLP